MAGLERRKAFNTLIGVALVITTSLGAASCQSIEPESPPLQVEVTASRENLLVGKYVELSASVEGIEGHPPGLTYYWGTPSKGYRTVDVETPWLAIYYAEPMERFEQQITEVPIVVTIVDETGISGVKGNSGEGQVTLKVSRGALWYHHFLLDASSYMKANFDGRTRIEHATEKLDTMVSVLIPRSSNLGLRSFGHKGGPTDCPKSELLVALAPAQHDTVRRHLQTLEAEGISPLVDSVPEAINDIALVAQSGTAYLIGVVFGYDDCRGLSPWEAVAAVEDKIRFSPVQYEIDFIALDQTITSFGGSEPYGSWAWPPSKSSYEDNEFALPEVVALLRELVVEQQLLSADLFIARTPRDLQTSLEGIALLASADLAQRALGEQTLGDFLFRQSDPFGASLRYERAGELYERLGRVSDLVDVMVLQAVSLSGFREVSYADFNRAVDILDTALSYEFADPRPYLFRGLLQAKFGEYTLARQDLQAALAIDNQLAVAQLGIGLVDTVLREADAQEEIRKALLLDPLLVERPPLRFVPEEFRNALQYPAGNLDYISDNVPTFFENLDIQSLALG